tara:strand:+ start:143 stop:478 length:336 start_codon:yes stop_codon:yes gene_type:complete
LTTAKKGATTARLESIPDPIMPDIAPFDYLISLVAEIGLNGVSWSEVYYWKELSGVQLRLWEIKQVKKLSMIYHNYAQQYEGSILPSPYRDVDTPSGMSEDVRNHLRNSKV